MTRTIRDQVACETYFRANKRHGQFQRIPVPCAGVHRVVGREAAEASSTSTFDQFLEGTDPTLVSLLDVEGVDDEDDDETRSRAWGKTRARISWGADLRARD